ncbi:reverse transcriptase domain-containing protein [Tanacetum coccineum]
MAPRGRPTRLNPNATPTPVADPTTTTSVTSAQLQAMIDEGVTAVLAARATTRNGDDSHTSGTGVRRNERAVRECTYQDFMKCQPLFFRGTEGVVDLTQWFERMETVFRISNCTVDNQVKFATCTLMGIALTWWNSHVRTVTNDVAYAMTWTDLKKKMTTKYCPRNEIKKIKAEMWNLKVKGTDVVAYNQRFQELALLCDRMFPEETDKIERYVGGMPDLIYSSVVASKPKTMQEAIEMATELMDRRINTFAERQAENKRKFEDTPQNNQNQQQNKRQNTGRAYAAGKGDKKPYEGTKPLCPKCNFNHYGPCTPTCNNCKKLGHLAKDCRSRPATANNNNNNNRNNNNNNNNPRAQGANTNAIVYFKCGVPGHFKKDCPQWKNKNQGNGNAVAKAYAVGVAGHNPDNNVVTGTFLLNNRCASILFDTGADRSFVSTQFSTLINIAPTTLDHSYNIELADGRIIWVNTIGISAMVIEKRSKTLTITTLLFFSSHQSPPCHYILDQTMSSPNHSTSNIGDAFSSMNILNYTSVSSDYFPASSGSISFNSSENSNIIPSVISPFYNNPCLKDVQAFYAKESPIPPPDPITPPAILTPSPVLSPSLLFDPRYFFVPEELLPPKKQIHSPYSSSTTLSNSSRNQTCDLSPSFLVYTTTSPQIFEIGKSSIKIHLKHHEEQIKDILNYLEELSFHRIEKME